MYVPLYIENITNMYYSLCNNKNIAHFIQCISVTLICCYLSEIIIISYFVSRALRIDIYVIYRRLDLLH